MSPRRTKRSKPRRRPPAERVGWLLPADRQPDWSPLMASNAARIDELVSLCKRRGIVFPSSEIYGGSRSAWDYGPLGVELKENIRRQWWRATVQMRDDVVGLDSAVILAPEVWKASGHLEAFVDPLIECQSCHKRFRADHLQEEFAERKKIDDPDTVDLK